ncbi:MAG: dipeptidase [Betaproteobacteria bacterium]
MKVTRRTALKTILAGAAAPMINLGRVRLDAQASRRYSTRAVDLVKESLVVDMLHQIVYRIDQSDVLKRWLYQPHGFTGADFDRYRQSGISVISFGNAARSHEDGIRLFGEFNGFIAGYPQWLLRVDEPARFLEAKRTGRLGIHFGLQNSTHFRSPDDVDTFYGLGQRSSQLTYNQANLIGDGAFEPRNGGLTEFGVKIVERMNRVGMVVDVAHAGDRTQLDAFRLSTKPVIISHGNARALDDGHPRCVSDESIRALGRSGGVMGINFISFMVKRREPVTIDDVIDHVDYVTKMIGIEHVGIGSDIGLESNDHADPAMFRRFMAAADPRYRVHEREAVEGLDHPLRFFDLTDALLRRGYSDAQIRLILGENWRRVLSSVWT